MNHMPHTTNGTHVIETEALTKRYDDITAVDVLGLRVRRGEVYGFLGPNGAGKTTMLGLIRPTSGRATVLSDAPGSAASLARTDAMIETPGFYPHLSGRNNLRVLAKYTGAPMERIDAVLDPVDLVDRAGDLFSDYSLGMKQRLGIAAALLKDPELLILDEPTNGLDPAGMAEMRDLIRELGHGHRTVLLSSHLMTEKEQVCDRIGIIDRGRLVAEGALDELRGEDVLVVQADPLEDARRLVAGMAGVRDVSAQDSALRITTEPEAAFSAYLNTRLVSEGIAVRELRHERASFESVFLTLTNPDNDDIDTPLLPHPDGPGRETREITHV